MATRSDLPNSPAQAGETAGERPPRLVLLDQGMAFRLTLLLRPPSFDDAALLDHWSHTVSWPVALLPLMQAHNDPIAFLAGMVRSLSAVLEKPDRLTAATDLPLEEGLVELLNEAAVAPGDFAWILRDYHHVTTAAIHHAVGRMLDYAPPQLHLYLTSDREPPLPNLPRLRVRRHLLTLRLPGDQV